MSKKIVSKEKVETKFHPDMAHQQEIIDAQTENPIDVSNSPDDADHNEHFNKNK